jgi:uncharacterized protein (TIGR02246 family)
MVRLAVICTALVIGPTVASGTRAQDLPSPEDTLRQWGKAFKEGRLTDVMAFYQDSERVLAWESSGKTRKGRAEIRAMYEEAFAEVVFESITLSALDVRQCGDAAWATCRFTADTVLRADGSRWTLDVRASFVLQREKDAWMIAFEHFSTVEGVPRVRRK